MTSILIAGPGEEPISLAEAKAWCRIDSADEDALVSALVAAARLQVESLTGRALIAQSWRLTRHCPLGRVIPLPVVPVSAVTAATAHGDAIEVTLQGDAVLLPGESYQELIIDYTAGYGGAADVPADLKQAVLLLVAYWFEHRDTNVQSTPSGFEKLIDGFRRVRL